MPTRLKSRTAHQAFLTGEALEQIAAITMENLYSFKEGKELMNEVFQST